MNFAERMAQPHYVYRLYDEHAQLLYVGVTCNPSRRLREHKTSPWFAEVSTVQVTSYADAAEAMEAERLAHLTEDPTRTGNPSNPLRLARAALSGGAA